MGRIVNTPDYGTELAIVETANFAVLTSAGEDGDVLCAYVRIIDKLNHGHEVVYWNLDEIAEGVLACPDDPATALNAILSSIELVAAGRFPPPGFKLK